MLGLVLALMLEGGGAAPAKAEPPVLVQPDWLQRPSGDDLERAYPEAATKAHADGRSTIRCTVTAEGSLANCTVISEDPSGLGFGEAALKLSPLFKMRPLSREGTPVDGATVNIPIRFVMEGSAAVTPPDWARRPLGEDFARVYPERAQSKGLGGRAVVRCDILASGLLDGCAVIQESPPDEGFGAAALKLTKIFRMKPMKIDGRPRPGGKITIPIVFILPGEPMEPYTAALGCYGRTAAEVGRNSSSPQLRDAARAWAGQALAAGAKANIPADETKKALVESHERAAAGKMPSGPALGDCLSAYRAGRRKP